MSAALLPSTATAAAYATGGSSPYRDTVMWMTWGGGTNGVHDAVISNGSTSTASLAVAANVTMDVSCAVSNIVTTNTGNTTSGLRSYRPGNYSGDMLDDLYNIGGTGGSNSLISGIYTYTDKLGATFTLKCNSTLNGVPFDLKGVVMADAESLAAAESLQATAKGTWTVMEVVKKGNYSADRTVASNGNSTIKFHTGADAGSGAVTFLTFDKTAYSGSKREVSIDFGLKGGGKQAIAIGLLVPYADFGDAPASYGAAMHLVEDLRIQADNMPAVASGYNMNQAAFTPGKLLPSASNYLGSQGPDAESQSRPTTDARGDDNSPTSGSVEENAWLRKTVSVLQAGEPLTEQISCNGTGTVAGWIDFDRNGSFDGGERAEATCSSGKAGLTWTIPTTLKPGVSYVRLRYATDASELALPTGVATSGEVEDHQIEIIAPKLSITKSNDSTGGKWAWGQNASYTLNVSNVGKSATGLDPLVSNAADVITVYDTMPSDIEPQWGWGISGINVDAWTCSTTQATRRISCTTSTILQAGESIRLTIPVVVGQPTPASGAGRTNYASVGGGHDPAYPANPPEPGAGCSAPGYCASSLVTVVQPSVAYLKTAEVAGNKSAVVVGDVITYTVSITVGNVALGQAVTLTDVLGPGLAFNGNAVASAAGITCQTNVPSAGQLSCGLPVGLAVGSHTIKYATVVTNTASGSVKNQVSESGTSTPGCGADGSNCSVTVPMDKPVVTYRKAVTSPAAGRTVAVGEEITYVLTVDVTVKATETPVTLTDVLGDGLAYIGIVSNSGGFQPPAGASPLVFTLPAGTSIGTHAISYKARVEPDAPTVLSNVVTATGGGGQLPTCVGACNTSTLRAEPTVTYSKIQVAPASGTPIAVGDTVTYRLTTNVANAMTTQPTELTDTLGTGLTFAAVTNAGIYEHDPANSSATQIFTLPAETEPGSYDVTYTATVNEYAETAVKNAVTASGDNPTCAGACAITTPVAAPTVSYSKSVALPAGKTSVAVGDVLTYTLTTVIGNSKTTDAVVLSDTLGNGLAFTEVTVPGAYASVTAGNPLEFSLPVNTSPGTYKVSYTATVTATASGTVTNAVSGSGGDTPSCAGSCGTSTPVAAPAVTYSKAVALPAGKTEVSVGDVLTYTLTTVVANSRTTDTVVLSDTLGNGLSFMAVTAAGSYAAATTSSPLTFTLPANTVPGTYQISYTVKVTAAAIGTVTNAVLGSGGDTPSCTVNCGTSTPVAAPAVTYSKSVVLPAGKTEVSVGDVLTYTLTTVVSDAQTTDTVVLTDTLGTGLAFTAVTAPGIYNAATSGNPLSFTLPANTVPGTYAVSYTATVTNAASSGTVTNAVLGSGTDNPSCGSTCTTTTPVAAPAVTYSKSVVLPAGKTSVSVGDVLTYTLTTVVANSKTTDAVVLSDTLGNGLAFTAVTVPGAYAAVTTGSPLVFALPVNTAPGTYKVSYTATVTAAASSTVTNVVLGTGGDTPSCAASCGTSTPVAAPAVTYSKSVVLPAGKTDVSVGDVLTYTLTTVVTNSKTTDAVFLSDTLGNGLAFTEVTVPGVYAAVTTGNPLAFTLPVNTAPGTYKVSYTATVTGAATGTVTNAVVGSGGDTPTCSGSCGTSTPVVVAAVRYSKSVVSPASGTQVKVGDQITYRLTTTVSGARTTADVVLSDALGNGLQFQSVTLAGGYTHASAGGLEVFTLPAGQEPNTDGSAKTYAMEYTAVVTAAATTAVDNSVTGSGGGGSPPTCVGSCTTTTPLGAAAVTYAKSVVAPAAGTEVKVGDEITYRLVATISDAQTTADLVLTDTLGTGLRFTAVTVAGDYVHSTAGGKEVFTLPAGKQPNADGSGRTYAVEYTAAVTAAATTSVQNNVVGGGGATPPICAGSCATTTPVVVPAVAYSKSVVLPAGKTEVSVGDVLTYTLTTVVSDAQTTDTVVLSDTLGTGLAFTAVTAPGIYGAVTSSNPLSFTLPANTVPGTYAVSYTATVTNAASGTVTNAVLGSGTDSPSCGSTCTTTTPVAAPAVTYSKSVVLPAGKTEVSVGDVLTYTLTTVVSNAQTTDTVVLSDTLGTGLAFTAVTDPGIYNAATSSNPLSFTLPANTVPGTYAVSYTATVTNAASGTVTNAVLGSGTDSPSCGTACTTTTPVAAPAVTYSKSVVLPAGKTEVSVGDVLTYTLTTVVSDAQTTDTVVLSDTLGTGLAFTAVTDPGIYNAATSSNPLSFTLPANTVPGSYAVSYTATVTNAASGTVTNAVLGSGPDSPSCGSTCTTTTPVAAPAVTYSKSVVLPAGKTEVSVGDVLTYTLTTVVSDAQTTDTVVLSDTLGTGLAFTAVTDPGIYNAATSSNPLSFTLPANTVPGSYAVSYTATVTNAASGTVTNAVLGSGPDSPSCGSTCTTTTPVAAPAVTYSKSVVLPAGKTEVSVGDVLTYTLTTVVSDAQTTDTVVLSDTLGTGLAFSAVTAPGIYNAATSSNPLSFTLPANTVPGTYAVSYTATVTNAASGTVTNAVLGSGTDSPSCGSTCTTTTPVAAPAVTYSKSVVLPAGKTEVSVGDVLTYTLTTVVSDAQTTDTVVLSDTLGTGLAFTAVTALGIYNAATSSNPLSFTLPANTVPGTYAVSYTATVTNAASGTVTNAVLGSGTDSPSCGTACTTTTPVAAPAVTYSKSVVLPAGKTEVSVGDVLTYTLTTVVSDAQTTDTVVLSDTLGTGLAFTAVTAPGIYNAATSSNPLSFTLPANTVPGTYAVSYTATVTNAASGTVTNAVLGSGTDSPSCGNTCTTTTPVAMPLLVVSKASNPGSGSTVNIGDTITYTLNAAVENAALFSEVVLTDTPDKALSISNLSAGCVLGEGVLRCTLPASTQAGAYAFSYDATVLPTANGKVKNVVAASSADPVMPVPECMSCATEHNVNAPLIRLTKTVGNTDVSIGDLVRYALTIENVGSSDLVDGEVIDTPPAGFSYVEGSVVVDDGDKVGTVSGAAPLRIAGLDVAAGESATVVYVMRVGAGVRSGTHVNQAQVRSRDGTPVSNTATAEVTLSGDPMIDDSLLLGTVFNDRDGDGWQDSAELSQLHVQGGFAADAYVAGSTSVDRGNGHQPQADASAPLLHGLALGRISARQSVADPVEDHQLVIRQHLTRLAFTDDFVLRNAQGVTVRMAADGQTRSEVSGDAAKGLTAALPVVERRVAQVADGYVVDYVISNQGIDERGIPGVRIASVEGLLIESDQYGRYHLEGVDGGKWERGRNFILKVDATTLPAGSVFTTENPLLRRITPGIPVRFDFGVKLDESLLGGGTELAEMALGEVFFAPGNAEVRARYLPVVEAMAAKVRQYQRGEVVIEAGAESQSLAFERANAVKTALVERLEGVDTRHLQIHVRGSIDMGSGLVAGLDSEGVLLGTVLFDTDKADIRDEFGPLLDTVARALEAMGGGRVAIIGHTDVRASHAYNLALGMRRARAVHDALAARVSAETRAKLRVEAEREPQAQAGALK